MVDRAHEIAISRDERDHNYRLKLGGILLASGLTAAVPALARADSNLCEGQETYVYPFTLQGEGLVGAYVASWLDCGNRAEPIYPIVDGNPIEFDGMIAKDAKTGEAEDAYLVALNEEDAKRVIHNIGESNPCGNLLEEHANEILVTDTNSLEWLTRLLSDGVVTSGEAEQFRRNVSEGLYVLKYASEDGKAGVPLLLRVDYDKLAENEQNIVTGNQDQDIVGGLRLSTNVVNGASETDLSLTYSDRPLDIYVHNVDGQGLEQTVIVSSGENDGIGVGHVVGGIIVGGLLYLLIDNLCDDNGHDVPSGLQGGEGPHNGVQ